jgi:ribosomal protein L34E
MKRCIKCKVPLDGFLGMVAGKLFKVTPSASNPERCNKCQDESPVYQARGKGPHHPSGKYHCQICNRDIDEIIALQHVKAEEYLIELIKKDHPYWARDKKTCRECLEYYRKLIKEAEI